MTRCLSVGQRACSDSQCMCGAAGALRRSAARRSQALGRPARLRALLRRCALAFAGHAGSEPTVFGSGNLVSLTLSSLPLQNTIAISSRAWPLHSLCRCRSLAGA